MCVCVAFAVDWEMAQWSTSSHSEAHGGIYEDGPHKVEVVSVAGWNSSSSCGPKNRVAENRNNLPPKPLLVVLPKEEGEYPVVQFQHGFTLQNTFYSQLMSHVASYGFIVVAPQVGSIAKAQFSRICCWGVIAFCRMLQLRYICPRNALDYLVHWGDELSIELAMSKYEFQALCSNG